MIFVSEDVLIKHVNDLGHHQIVEVPIENITGMKQKEEEAK